MPEFNLPPNETHSKLKLFLKFIGLIVLVIILAGLFEYWRVSRRSEAIKNLVENMERSAQEDYIKAMADTYGGKTPQETLRMYISAVEKGDYELASKYFILGEQEKELQSLRNSPPENIKNLINFLNEALKNQGSYSEDKTGFAIRRPVLVDLRIYPNGIWKIVEI